MLPSPDPRPGLSFQQRFAEIEIAGAAIMLGAIISFVMAINFGGVLYEWNSAQISLRNYVPSCSNGSLKLFWTLYAARIFC
jgi:hypothetical protein